MTQADPMNDPSTEISAPPPCAICGKPGAGALIDQAAGLGKSHCGEPDCFSKVKQLSSPAAVAWDYSEPWPPAPKVEAPAMSDLGGGASAASAGAAPPAGDFRFDHDPRHWTERRQRPQAAPGAALQPQVVKLEGEELARAREALGGARPVSLEERDGLRLEARQHAYLCMLEALEEFKAAKALAKLPPGVSPFGPAAMPQLVSMFQHVAACFAKLEEAGELVEHLADL